MEGTINGELPPYTFDVGSKSDPGNWHARQVDGEIIKKYLGNGDGGTIKLLLHLNFSDDDAVRVLTETIYIEQPDKSSKKKHGLYGFIRQLGGGENSFNLGTTEKCDNILPPPPPPENWVFVRNYSTGGLKGLLSPNNGGAWKAADEYRLEFLTKEDVSATVIIYDR